MSFLHSQTHLHFFQRDTTSQSQSSGKISPAILFIIIILAVIFFISGLLHLLVRFLMKKRSSLNSISQSNRYQHDNVSNSDTFQRQLQNLFQLHDSGLDQAFIDALPLFQYKEIIGLKEPFDCAVCLCEFTEQDKLRLLPLCSHAFHIDCIDTWLLSNSTCPLCRGVLYAPGTAFENPVFDFEDSRDENDGGGGCGGGGCGGGGGMIGKNPKGFEIEIGGEKKVFPVRLGKFRSTSNEVSQEESIIIRNRDVGETSSSNLDARRCYSMGSYQYIVADLVLQVTLSPKLKSIGENEKSIVPTSAIDNVNADAEARKINVGSKKESLSVSKIWLWSKKSKFPTSSSNADFNGVTVDMSLPWTNRNQNHAS